MENKRDKGKRMLTEGRLQVVACGVVGVRAAIVATCRGDSGKVYDLGFDAAAREWRCNCEARTECAHLIALKLVTVEPTS